MAQKVTLPSNVQWLVAPWHTVLSLTVEADQVSAVVSARVQWTGGSAATSRSVRLVRDSDGLVIASASGLPMNGNVTIANPTDVLMGDVLNLEVQATGAQQAPCQIQAPTSGFFGFGSSPGTYLNVS